MKCSTIIMYRRNAEMQKCVLLIALDEEEVIEVFNILYDFNRIE